MIAKIQELADALYRRVDWNWAQNGGSAVTLGWKPKSGFLRYRWQGYNEALLIYLLGLGSPTHPLPAESYPQWTATYQWRRFYDQEILYAGPLFIHQFPHIWVDFRGIQDEYMRGMHSDYFENSRRATHVHRQYAIANPRRFTGYGEDCWGITASDGPGPSTLSIKGEKRRFFGYKARGAPEGPDDGSLAPWSVAASLPFAPEIVAPALRYFEMLKLRENNPYGFKATFNATIGERALPPQLWVSPFHFGINQGPVVLMAENFRTGLIWNLMRRCPYLVAGLRQGRLCRRLARPRMSWTGFPRESPTGGSRLEARANRLDDPPGFVRIAHPGWTPRPLASRGSRCRRGRSRRRRRSYRLWLCRVSRVAF